MLSLDFPRMAEIVPEEQRGIARIEHFKITEHEARFSRLRAAIGHSDEWVDEGRYAKLTVGGGLVMTDTDMERNSNRAVVQAARGQVLVAGLGLGMILHPILAKTGVEHVTVIEKYQDVIDIVTPTLPAEKLTIICADIFDWKPAKGERWDVIYFDVWADISTDALEDMSKLHRRFRSRLNPGGWMDSWKRRDLMCHKRRGW